MTLIVHFQLAAQELHQDGAHQSSEGLLHLLLPDLPRGRQLGGGECCNTLRTFDLYTATKVPFIFSQKKKLHGLSHNFHIHVSVSDLYVYSQDRSTNFPAAEMDAD